MTTENQTENKNAASPASGTSPRTEPFDVEAPPPNETEGDFRENGERGYGWGV
jgi:hypothetical protein